MPADAGQSSDTSPIDAAQTGEMFKVRVTITLPNDAYYLLVEDFIPAGTEILDTSLKTSQLGSVASNYDDRHPFDDGWGWWFFRPPQVYDNRISWAADYLPAGTYELTYSLTALQPGEYQVLPARAWQFYFPEVQGTSAGEVFSVKAGD